MKKSFFYAICVMVVATTVAVVSCRKEKEPQVEAEVPQADAQMQAEIDRIVGFRKQVDERKANPGTKSAETVTLDEAINNIVDLFNVTYTEPMAYYTESERHEFTLSVALTADGKVLLDDVVAAYEQALANAREAYHGSNLPDKAYQFLTVTCTPQRDGTAELKFDGQYGSKGNIPPAPTPHCDGPFGEGDDWHYKNCMGRCCDTCLLESGADKELQGIIMAEVRAQWPEPPAGCRGFYSHITDDYNFHAPEFGGVFYSEDVDQTCISWEYMNWYLQGERINLYSVVPDSLGISLKPQNNTVFPSRYYVLFVEIFGEKSLSPAFIRHNTIVRYGRYNFVDENTIGQQPL